VQAYGVEKDVSLQRQLLQTGDAGGTVDCQSKCNGRCAVAGKPDACMHFCLMCCNRCKCVAPGTKGFTPG
ncbi:hypothetical protein KI387_032364, partial [Taxus chinensis]